ncbi:type I-F CRISPR-associated endonuclease Cas1f [Vibrio harveyi]|uniref:type I-F CRISPR-associated endonuclease Cas1f n=1 Tax=Vibrio harveyi TaxID=669 RepID=UPI003CF680A5
MLSFCFISISCKHLLANTILIYYRNNNDFSIKKCRNPSKVDKNAQLAALILLGGKIERNNNLPILPSHKNGVYYVEHCKIVAKDTRLSFIRSEEAFDKAISLPHLNLSVLLLGPGTSLTQQAAKLLSLEGVIVGFTAGGGSPLFLASNSEYRPTEYLQAWIKWWEDEDARLAVAKFYQMERISNVEKYWPKYFNKNFTNLIGKPCQKYRSGLQNADSVNELLGHEANFTKSLYKILAKHYGVNNFQREHKNGSEGSANQFLDHGNYIAYGFANVALWGLGVPPSLAVIHGKTRRGALVFDLADVFKDSLVLPCAFKCASEDYTSSGFRKELIDLFDKTSTLKNMFNITKKSALLDIQ